MPIHRFPVEYQMDSQDCGPASLKIIARHFGKFYSLQYLRDRCGITKEGVSLLDLGTGAESIGLRTLAIKCTLDEVVASIPFPAILFWNESHFVVVYAADRIVVLDKGFVVETGNHDSLMEKKGHYFSLVAAQMQG